jgi:hypothetical protein
MRRPQLYGGAVALIKPGQLHNVYDVRKASLESCLWPRPTAEMLEIGCFIWGVGFVILLLKAWLWTTRPSKT